VEIEWLAAVRTSSMIAALFPAVSGQEMRRRVEASFRSVLTPPMVLHVSSGLVFPTTTPSWKPDLPFLCITGIPLMVEKMVRPSQMM
jgi:hypothetical protein